MFDSNRMSVGHSGQNLQISGIGGESIPRLDVSVRTQRYSVYVCLI